MLDWLELRENTVPDSYFGFHPGRSVEMALPCPQANCPATKARRRLWVVIGFCSKKKLLTFMSSSNLPS